MVCFKVFLNMGVDEMTHKCLGSEFHWQGAYKKKRIQCELVL